jgi:ribonuclease HII
MGIDEAGRAPLAGPVSVGIVMVPENFDVKAEFPGVKDSKKLSSKKREELYEKAKARMAQGDITFCFRLSDNAYIDTFGITRAVRRALFSGVRACLRSQALAPRNFAGEMPDVHIYLDGLLHAPKEYSQETIIRGDDLVPVISLASIIAKVERDRLMHRLAKRYPGYGFEHHVGYPTREHREAIERLGLCEIHRVTYCHFNFNAAVL